MKNKTYLITGGTGTLGNALVRRMLALPDGPKAIRIFSRDEAKQETMAQEIPDERLRFFIGDIRDKERVERAIDGVDVVIHAAALKRIVACEYNPREAIKTNVLGVQNLIEAAIDRRVEKFMAVSTDKAVNPVNLYGATKLCMEKLVVQANTYVGSGPTKFSCVRYGNVVGSRGSVLPVFKSQAPSGRLTLTDERMTRFWITIEQAVMFITTSIEIMRGGEIFVPKIQSERIIDLAMDIGSGCEIDITGIRPGEKLHEVLITQEEARKTVDIGDRYIIEPDFEWWGLRRHGGTRVEEGFTYTSSLGGGSRSLHAGESRQTASGREFRATP